MAKVKKAQTGDKLKISLKKPGYSASVDTSGYSAGKKTFPARLSGPKGKRTIPGTIKRESVTSAIKKGKTGSKITKRK